MIIRAKLNDIARTDSICVMCLAFIMINAALLRKNFLDGQIERFGPKTVNPIMKIPQKKKQKTKKKKKKQQKNKTIVQQ